MSTSAPCRQIPTVLVAGDNVAFSLYDADFPNADYTATFVLSGFTVGAPFTVTSATDGLGFLFSATSAETALFAPGKYSGLIVYSSIVGSLRHVKHRREVTVTPDPTVALAPTDAQLTLTALQSAFKTLASGTNQVVNVGGQQFTKKNPKDLQDAIDRQRIIVDAEKRSLGLPSSGGQRTISTRFC